MTKKIGLFLNSHPSQGGAFQYSQSVLGALAALPDSDYEKLVVYTRDEWFGYLRPYNVGSLHVPLGIWQSLHGKLASSFLPVELWRSRLSRLHRVAQVLKRQMCDLWVFPAQDTWSYLMPVHALGTIHDLMHRYEKRFPEVGREYRIREKHYRNMCRWCRGVLVDSRVGKEHVMESYGLDQRRIHVLPFVAPAYICSGGEDPGLCRRYRLPRKFIFYPAQYWEHKNHKGLVLAAARLKEAVPDLKVVFVGFRKNGYASTWKLIQELGLRDRFFYFDYVPESDMVGFYRRARAMVMPTFFGPTNIPPLEAMALGTPMAVSAVYGMEEQLGDAALYFDPSSVDAIAEALRLLWTDDRLCRDLSARSLARASQWGPLHFNQRFQNIIEDTLVPEGNGRY